MTIGSVLVRAGYGVACIAAASTLVMSGYARSAVDAVRSFGSSDAIQSGLSIGEQNILLMGLESRTDYEGNILPADLLAAMHAGSVEGVANGVGGQATNTLILIHIFNGGKKAVGFSIPRDDWVAFPHAYDGESHGKIDQAYGLAWAQSLGSTADSSMSKSARYFQANEAGQAAAVDTVESLTGVRIDHFAEVNLAGYYELAKSFGGIMVCLKSWDGGTNLHDTNSGFHVAHAGVQHLWADQALAFVRERDNLPNGDIDRTRRQQAVIDYVVWKLEHGGILSDLSELSTLLDTAKQYVITDSGWDILEFATQMRALTGKNMTFQTAPYLTTSGEMAGQTVNLVDPVQIKKAVREAFYPVATSSPAPSSSPSPSPSSPSASPVSSTDNGGMVSVSDNAPYGIPCVY